MLKAPENYLQFVLSKNGIEKNISKITLQFILNSDKNIHFIIDEKEIDVIELVYKISLEKHHSACGGFDFMEGQRIISLKSPQDGVFSISRLNPQIDLEKENDESRIYQLIWTSSIGIRRYRKVKADANPYLPEYGKYFWIRRHFEDATLLPGISARQMRLAAL